MEYSEYANDMSMQKVGSFIVCHRNPNIQFLSLICKNKQKASIPNKSANLQPVKVKIAKAAKKLNNSEEEEVQST